MGLWTAIRGLFGTKAMDSAVPGSCPQSWLENGDTISGETVNTWTALQVSTVLQCVTVISNGIAQIPFRLMGKQHKLADKEQLYFLFKEKPNRWQSAFDFWKLIGFHLALQGKCVVWVVRVRGEIQELIPFPPQNYIVTQRYENGWAVRDYTLIKDDGSTVIVPERDIWELRWRDWDIRIGLNQLEVVRNVVAIALAGDRLTGSSFKNGAQLAGALMAKQVLRPEQQEEIKKSWQEQYGGAQNAHKTIVLGADFSYQQFGQKNADAQFIEQKKFQIEEICRAWNVNPLLVFYFDNTASYSNSEQMMVQHVVHTMSPWYRMIEESAYVNLLTEEQRRKKGLYFAFNDSALMRTDAKTRANFYSSLFNIGSITPNEIRSLEDMPPMEGGDELYIQGAVVPLKDAGLWQDRGLSQSRVDKIEADDNPDPKEPDDETPSGDENNE